MTKLQEEAKEFYHRAVVAEAKLKQIRELTRLNLSDVLEALDYASEGRTWSGPKPDLLGNYLNRKLDDLLRALDAMETK